VNVAAKQAFCAVVTGKLAFVFFLAVTGAIKLTYLAFWQYLAQLELV